MQRVDADTLVRGNIVWVGQLAWVVANQILGPLRTRLALRLLQDPERLWVKAVRRNLQVPKLDGPDAIVLEGFNLRCVLIPDDEPVPDET
jgi:hypothetical protein